MTDPMDLDIERADKAMRCLIAMREAAELGFDDAGAELLDELIKALQTGGDHPLLDRWLEQQR